MIDLDKLDIPELPDFEPNADELDRMFAVKESVKKTISKEEINKNVDNLIDAFNIGLIEETTLEELESLRDGSEKSINKIGDLIKQFCKQ